jgi:hypothetical protein
MGSVAFLLEAQPMTTDAFRKMLSRQPFQPFRLVMSSGKSYDVRHPEMAWLLKNDVLVGIADEDDGLPAEFDICPLFHVATVEPILSDSSAE